MSIRIRSNGTVLSESQFRDLHPQTSFPIVLSEEILDDLGADLVYEGAQPTGEAWQTVEGDGVEQVNGKWKTKYKLVPETLDADGLIIEKGKRLDALADRRWRAETAGILVGNIPLKTDEDTTAKLTAAYVKADKDPSFIVNWKAGAGVFVTLDAATLIVLGDAVTAHVQACFSNERTLSASILAAQNYQELIAIDIETGWPT